MSEENKLIVESLLGDLLQQSPTRTIDNSVMSDDDLKSLSPASSNNANYTSKNVATSSSRKQNSNRKTKANMIPISKEISRFDILNEKLFFMILFFLTINNFH